jgi:phenylacetate-CoA ligase
MHVHDRNTKEIWDIFEYHLAHNPVYKSFVNTKRIQNWTDIPVLTKKHLQQPLSERLSKGVKKRDMHIHNTSGSSGTPFFFAKDKFCHAMSWAVIDDRFGWHGIEMGRSLQARFYGIPLGGISYYKEKLKDILAARVRFPVFDLSEKKLREYLQLFSRHPFVYINGYTSSLVLFARYIIQQGITLKESCPTLLAVFTTSEVCDDIDRKIMEQGFGVKVVNEYGAAELDLIAVQDVEGDWLLNYETLYVEILDDAGMPVPPGVEGRVVITSLFNKAMPFIRYELGDMAVLSDRQKGPYKILEKVSGRINDVAILPSGKKAPGLTFYYISKSLLEQGGILKEFIIRQTAIDQFTFEYVADRMLTKAEELQVQKAMDKYLEPGLIANFEHRDVITRTKAGKLKHFYSEIDP